MSHSADPVLERTARKTTDTSDCTKTVRPADTWQVLPKYRTSMESYTGRSTPLRFRVHDESNGESQAARAGGFVRRKVVLCFRQARYWSPL